MLKISPERECCSAASRTICRAAAAYRDWGTTGAKGTPCYFQIGADEFVDRGDYEVREVMMTFGYVKKNDHTTKVYNFFFSFLATLFKANNL